MKKLAISLFLGLILVVSLGSACFASHGPDFEVKWDGSIDGGVVGVGGSVATANTYTSFSSGGSFIKGCFGADDACCGETSNGMWAIAKNGNINYLSVVGGEEAGAMVKLGAASDCTAEMYVRTSTECDYMSSNYCVEAKGCEFEVSAIAATYDESDMNALAVYASGESGDADIRGSVQKAGNVSACLDVDANGETAIAVGAASNNIASVGGVTVDDGTIALVAEGGDGLWANLHVFAGEIN